MVCDCTTSKSERSRGFPACGEDCLNRLLMIEWLVDLVFTLKGGYTFGSLKTFIGCTTNVET